MKTTVKTKTEYKVLSKRPIRLDCIGREDILNLKIALYTTNDVKQFLEAVK